MTQHELVIKYIEEKGYICPAKLNDKERDFKGQWLGSQTDKRCRELRTKIGGKWCNPYGKQMVESEKIGKYQEFYLIGARRTTFKVISKSFNVEKWNEQFYPSKKEEKITNVLF